MSSVGKFLPHTEVLIRKKAIHTDTMSFVLLTASGSTLTDSHTHTEGNSLMLSCKLWTTAQVCLAESIPVVPIKAAMSTEHNQVHMKLAGYEVMLHTSTQLALWHRGVPCNKFYFATFWLQSGNLLLDAWRRLADCNWNVNLLQATVYVRDPIAIELGMVTWL